MLSRFFVLAVFVKQNRLTDVFCRRQKAPVFNAVQGGTLYENRLFPKKLVRKIQIDKHYLFSYNGQVRKKRMNV